MIPATLMSQLLGQINSEQLDVSTNLSYSSVKPASYNISKNPQDNQPGLYCTPTTCNLPYYSINKRTDTKSKITDNACVMYTLSCWHAGYTTCQITHLYPIHRLERSPASEIKEVTLISHRSTYIASTPPRQIPTEYMIIAETAAWRIGCKHPQEWGQGAGSSELLYQLDGRCYFLSRQPISMRSVKDGQSMAEVKQETAQDSIMSLVAAYMHIHTYNAQIHTHILNIHQSCTIQKYEGLKTSIPETHVFTWGGIYSGLWMITAYEKRRGNQLLTLSTLHSTLFWAGILRNGNEKYETLHSPTQLSSGAVLSSGHIFLSHFTDVTLYCCHNQINVTLIVNMYCTVKYAVQ